MAGRAGKENSIRESGSSMLKMPLGEAAKLWLESKKGSIAATTFDRYTDALNRYVYPEFKDAPIRDITDARIERFANSIVEDAKKEGRNITINVLQMSVGLLTSIVSFARNDFTYDNIEIGSSDAVYEALGPADLTRVCSVAKHNEVPEMLAAMLTLFTGIRMGEICALEWKDVDLENREIFIHQSVHRVRKTGGSDENASGKYKRGTSGTYGGRDKVTGLMVEEIPTRKHIRRVNYPAALNDYVRKFYKEGASVLTGMCDMPADARTIQNRIKRILKEYRIENINFQRLHKTYVEGKADEKILRDVFSVEAGRKPYKSSFDKARLTEEMENNLKELRLLTGLSVEEMGEILGVSSDEYQDIEDKRRRIDWREYMTLLFLFDYNKRTSEIAGTLGLFPDELRRAMSESRNENARG